MTYIIGGKRVAAGQSEIPLLYIMLALVTGEPRPPNAGTLYIMLALWLEDTGSALSGETLATPS